ncbi:CoA transferase [Spirillospora sp. NPDC047279]|uniref:CoA transferase n=1 Tax=Spirillospora sp. NPDC047279 TaxID=3155478 RepID=UPI0033C80236
MEKVDLASWAEPVESFLTPLTAVAGSFTALTGVVVDARTVLFLRAELAGLRRPGRTSANGTCHLLRAADGWTAVNLARPDDLAALPALLGSLGATGPASLDGLRAAARRVPAADVAAAAQLLHIPAAAHGSARGSGPPATAERHGTPSVRPPAEPRVVDFSAMWAGPLCARLLGLAGARVTKVESTARPDGARSGSPAFYRWLHDGHESRVVDFSSPGALAGLVEQADVVIEASRPRALRRLGLHAERFLAERPGRVWVSITGYGRDDDRVAFGDDAAVAGGLTGRAPDGSPVFLGDAIADPVTGVFAAEAAARSLAGGGGELVPVSMSACAATLAASAAPAAPC